MPRNSSPSAGPRPPSTDPADDLVSAQVAEDELLMASPEDDRLAAQAFGAPPPAAPAAQNGQESPQPSPPERVSKSMATAAMHPQTHATQPTLAAASSLPGLQPAFIADYSQLDDAEIMLRVRDGDFVGYEYLVQKYRRAMVSFLYRMTRNQAIGEELAQEVFLRVYRSRATYRAEARFTTWLYRIATNLGVNHARDNKLESTASNVYLDATDSETGTRPDVADSTPNIEQDIVREERLAAIRAHVEALPERQRMAVLMHKYQDLDYREIGRVLKLSESATKSLLFRAYETLRERLKEFV
jgi:RNA polymerase sigma-70 factor (ECF subfamily)